MKAASDYLLLTINCHLRVSYSHWLSDWLSKAQKHKSGKWQKCHLQLPNLVCRAGIEPATIGLKDRCSTTELPAHTLRIIRRISIGANAALAYALQFIADEYLPVADFDRQLRHVLRFLAGIQPALIPAVGRVA